MPGANPNAVHSTRDPRAPGRVLTLGAIVLLALGLRLWHLAEGLPEFFEEAFPLRRAFDMAGWETGRVDWNPRAFHYPSLSFYLHLAAQWLHYGFGKLAGVYARPGDFYLALHVDPTAHALVARLLGVAADLATLLAVFRIGERLRAGAGLLAALIVALSATLIGQSRAIVTDGLMTAFAAWSLERMLAYRDQGGRARLGAAALLMGLAAGTKYPAAMLVLPLAWATWEREGKGMARPLALALFGAAGVFAMTSPFLLADLAQTGFDLLRIASLVGEGQLGTFGRPGAVYYGATFARDFGWVAPILLLLSLAGFRRGAGPGLLGVWLFLLVFATPIVLGRVEFERYLVPIVPAAALLLAVAALALPETESRLFAGRPGWRDGWRALLVLALVMPAAWSGFRAASVGDDTTQGRARRFLEARLSAGEVLVEESYGAGLQDRWEADRVTRSLAFARADTSWQRRFLAKPVARAVRLPLLVAGKAVVMAPAAGGGLREIRLFDSSADLNRVFYEPALFAGVDWALTSGAVRGRYQADTARFARQAAFYRWLDGAASLAASFSSGGSVTGPEIRIYRLTESARAALGALALDSLWWARDIPDSARTDLSEAMAGFGSAGASDGPPPWALGLGTLFERQIEPFVYRLSLELAQVGRCAYAIRLADAIRLMSPGHLQATGLVASCAEAMGDPWRAQRAIESLLAAHEPHGRLLPDIRLEYARLLSQTGARDEARRQLDRVLAAPAVPSETRRRAREMLRQVERVSTH